MNKLIAAEDIWLRLDRGEKLLIIDVREEWEHEESNFGFYNLPLYQIPEKWEQLTPYVNQEIILHCKSGTRSRQARIFLEAKGFLKVYEVAGGFTELKRSKEILNQQ